jgi:signal peptidase II
MIQKKDLVSILSIIVFSIFIDQTTKLLVVSQLTPLDPPREIIGNLLRFKLVYNPYGVFGFNFGPSGLYYILSLAGALVLIYIALSMRDRTAHVIFGFIVGGSLGNLLDRLRLNFVIDFIDMGIGDMRWFTYNLADAFITVGAIFIVVRELFFKGPRSN